MNQTVNKKVRNATILEYEGIIFKSKLELYCYKKLQELPIYFTYNSIRFNLLESFVFNNVSYELIRRKNYKKFEPTKSLVKGITYMPDFIGNYANGKMFIIETKGNPNDAFPLRWKLFKYYLTQNNIEADLYMPRNQKHIEEVVEIIKSKDNVQI